jgi:membrane fusion protein, multidrug efflux system
MTEKGAPVSLRDPTDKARIPRHEEPRPEMPRVPEKPAAQGRRRWLRWALFFLLPLALLAGAYRYVAGGQIMSTDDAYVDAEKVGISTDVSGIVAEVAVRDNDHVTARQLLYRLDPRQFQIAVDSAKADLAETVLTIDAMKQSYRQALSDIAGEQAQVGLDQKTYDRDAMLLRSRIVSQAAYDQAKAALESAKSKLQSVQWQAKVQLARLDGNADIPTRQHPQYLQAQARLAEAQRQLNDTVVRAPFPGIVTDVPSIAPGKYLPASATAFYLVESEHGWIEANPKETELTYVRPGQSVTVTIDGYPDRKWHGTVQSISPAAAEEFSLLPAQNTSGNWVKVVQRVPMRVRVDTTDRALPPLRAGMSAAVDVETGHTRGFPHFLTALF